METDQNRSILEIEALAVGGRGVARPEDGPVWMVAGGLPGDQVEARATRRRPRVVDGAVERLVRPSPVRRAAICPIQGRCGGCPWMTLEDEAQADWKRRLVVDSLQRLGKLDVPVDPLVRGTRLLGYRNKIELAVIGRPGRGLATAMHAGGGDGPVHVTACAVQHPEAAALLVELDAALAEVETDSDAAASWRFGLRRSDTDGKLLLVSHDSGQAFPDLPRLAERLEQRCPMLVGTVRLSRRREARGGAMVSVVRGRGWLREKIGENEFRVPAASFLQVNGETGRRLVSLVQERAGSIKGRRVVDLYGGLGVYGLALARRGALVSVCEADNEAVHAGREAARRAGLDSVTFAHAEVGRWLAAGGVRQAPDLIVANPPRRGLERRVRRALVEIGARRVIIVSCDPGTLARDLRELCAGGYTVTRVTPVDLFPQTAHVEVVALLERTAPG